jgi:hypothetical protein
MMESTKRPDRIFLSSELIDLLRRYALFPLLTAPLLFIPIADKARHCETLFATRFPLADKAWSS